MKPVRFGALLVDVTVTVLPGCTLHGSRNQPGGLYLCRPLSRGLRQSIVDILVYAVEQHHHIISGLNAGYGVLEELFLFIFFSLVLKNP